MIDWVVNVSLDKSPNGFGGPNFVVGLQIGSCSCSVSPSVNSGDAEGINVPSSIPGTTDLIVGNTIAFLNKCQTVSLVNLSSGPLTLVASGPGAPNFVPGNSVTLRFVKIADFPCCGTGW